MTERNIPTIFSFVFKRNLFFQDAKEGSLIERELDFHYVSFPTSSSSLSSPSPFITVSYALLPVDQSHLSRPFLK